MSRVEYCHRVSRGYFGKNESVGVIMKKTRYFLLALLAVSLAPLIVLISVRGSAPDAPATAAGEKSSAAAETAPAPPPPSVVTFMAAGDNLIHKPLFRQAKERARGGAAYDFTPAYAGVKPILARADLAMINQETPIASAVAAVSSYPMFCSPAEAGDAVYNLGFRAVGLSNNHMLDKGAKGAAASLDYWASKPGVCAFGAYRDAADSLRPHTLTVNGIKFAFVGATFSYNGLQLPSGSALVLPLLEQEELLRQMISIARENADVVVVAPHWGTEDSTTVHETQKALARKFVDWGADLVIGTHPHVLQTMEYLEKPGGGQAFVAYSLGNFISGQRRAPNLVGGILELTVEKDNETGAVTVRAPRLYPTVTQYEQGYGNVRLIPWTSYTQALGRAHGVRGSDSRFGYAWAEGFLKQVVPGEFLAMGE